MKNILIPNDFSDKTLQLIVDVSMEYSTSLDKINIILFHCVDLPCSIAEPLFFPYKSLECEKEILDFKIKCNEILQSQYGNTSSIRHTVFYGKSTDAFRNFCEVNSIHSIAITQDFNYKDICEKSFDPTNLIIRSGYELLVFKKDNSKDNLVHQLAEKFFAEYSSN